VRQPGHDGGGCVIVLLKIGQFQGGYGIVSQHKGRRDITRMYEKIHNYIIMGVRKTDLIRNRKETNKSPSEPNVVVSLLLYLVVEYGSHPVTFRFF